MMIDNVTLEKLSGMFSADELAIIEAYAEAQHQPVQQFVRRIVLAAVTPDYDITDVVVIDAGHNNG